MILLGNDDIEKNVAAALKFKNKLKRINVEVASHQPNIERILVY